ncbi:MAG: hypothetical protein HYY03_02065 [Chloroflexi bacterium]|nr:hypothetical protein [Chloroflexota bacterium]
MFILFVLALAVLLGFVALVIDVGLAFQERRSLQNAVDAAALAAAQDLSNGEPKAAAIGTALEFMNRNGYTDTESTEVNIPPLAGPYASQSGYVEVSSMIKAPMAFLGLFLDEPYAVTARAVALGLPGSQTDDGEEVSCDFIKDKKKKKECEKGEGSGLPPAVTVPSVPCGSPTVDGRVTTSDGYTKIGDLKAGSTDYGDVFFACDGTYLFFAMRLNALDPTGGVSNENVYGGGGGGKKGGSSDYHSLYQTGWSDHTFNALKGSDRARFQVTCDGTAVHDFVQDYLRPGSQGDWVSDALSGDGSVLVKGPAESASSLEWNLEHPQESGWGDNPGEDPLTQSPPFSPKYPTCDPQYSGWVWEIIYEFKVPASDYASCTGPIQFGLTDFAGSNGPVQGIHSSPAKVKDAATLFIEAAVLELVE